MSSITVSAHARPGAGRRTGAPLAARFARRRLFALAVLVVVVTTLTVTIGRIGAQAELDDPVAGHVVLEPGDTLWEVAARSAPEGVDPRAQLERIKDLNGFDGASLDAWTVVLLPAR